MEGERHHVRTPKDVARVAGTRDRRYLAPAKQSDTRQTRGIDKIFAFHSLTLPVKQAAENNIIGNQNV